MIYFASPVQLEKGLLNASSWALLFKSVPCHPIQCKPIQQLFTECLLCACHSAVIMRDFSAIQAQSLYGVVGPGCRLRSWLQALCPARRADQVISSGALRVGDHLILCLRQWLSFLWQYLFFLFHWVWVHRKFENNQELFAFTFLIKESYALNALIYKNCTEQNFIK